MNITRKETDKLTYLLTVEIDKTEANEKKLKELKEYRKKAEIKGFRKGMAPMGLIEKLYGNAAMADSVNSLITEGINNYIKEQNLNLIGEPLPNEELQKKIDWNTDEKFEFLYDIATRPDVKISVDEKDKVKYYELEVTPDALKKYKEDVLRQFGSLVDSPAVGDDDFLVVDFEQGDKKVEKTYISLKNMEAKSKKQFDGKKVGDSFDVDVVKTFPNDVDRASMLKIKKEDFDASAPVYKLTIREIKTFTPAQENQDLYDRFCGKDKVKDSAGFEAELKSRLEADYKQESDFRFRKDLIDYLVKKADIALPENFLKRWLFNVNEGKFTMEQIEREFPLFLQDYRWQMIANKVVTDNNIKIERADLLSTAKQMTASQFAMYGMSNLPDAQLTEYAESLLKNEKEINRIYERCEEEKVVEYVKGVITIDKKSVTHDELMKLNEAQADVKKPSKKAPAKKSADKKEDGAEETVVEKKPAAKRAASKKKESDK